MLAAEGALALAAGTVAQEGSLLSGDQLRDREMSQAFQTPEPPKPGQGGRPGGG